MDQGKSLVPRMMEKSKDFVGADRLPSKISGILTYSGWYKGHRKVVFCINHDQVKSKDLHFISFVLSLKMAPT